MSEPVVAIDVVAVLLAVTGSFVAPVVPVTVTVPVAVGAPLTVQVMPAPAATVAGGVGVHEVVRPAGRPDTAQLALVALAPAEAALVHVNVPLYGWFRSAVAGSPERSIDISEPVGAMVLSPCCWPR
ncbi:MAG: hypothetical protein R3D67_07690 [Hyphomicrobiaceae bacterium]